MGKLFAVAIFFVTIGALGVAGISSGAGIGRDLPQPVVEAGFGWDSASPSPSPSPQPQP